jgi:hypothetical protein
VEKLRTAFCVTCDLKARHDGAPLFYGHAAC